MVTLNKRWYREGYVDRGEWWLVAPKHKRAPNRAFITWPKNNGRRKLYVWDDTKAGGDWVEHTAASNLRALKAIGRIEAARRLT